jgi:hypothetical protein
MGILLAHPYTESRLKAADHPISYQLINMAALLRYGRYLASPNDDYFAAGDINVGFTPIKWLENQIQVARQP